MPVNVAGGLKSKRPPDRGERGLEHAMAAVQLNAVAGELQLRNAGRAAVHDLGGFAIANYVTVLERRTR